jgi:predicted  nucleic acid-binding Zn-ribbon protein
MDQELISYLDKRFGEVNERFGEMNKRFDAVETDIKELKKDAHETRILLENLQDKVQLVAEGLVGVVEGFKTHRAEVSEEIKGIRVFVQQSYSDLDRRVRVLEASETDH